MLGRLVDPSSTRPEVLSFLQRRACLATAPALPCVLVAIGAARLAVRAPTANRPTNRKALSLSSRQACLYPLLSEVAGPDLPAWALGHIRDLSGTSASQRRQAGLLLGPAKIAEQVGGAMGESLRRAYLLGD